MKNIIAISTGLLLSLSALTLYPKSTPHYTLELNLTHHSPAKTIENNLRESFSSFPFEGFIQNVSGEITYKVIKSNDEFLIDTQVFEKTSDGKKLVTAPALVLHLDKEGMVALGDTAGNDLTVKAKITSK